MDSITDVINMITVACPEVAREADKLRRHVRQYPQSPLTGRRLAILYDNARGCGAEFTPEEKRALGQMLVVLEPSSEKTHRVSWRMSEASRQVVDGHANANHLTRSEALEQIVQGWADSRPVDAGD